MRNISSMKPTGIMAFGSPRAMTEPDEVAAPDDTGSDTLARFEYQAHATFPYLLELVRGERVTEVFAEHVEDIAVHEQELWRFLQVKSRDPGRGQIGRASCRERV